MHASFGVWSHGGELGKPQIICLGTYLLVCSPKFKKPGVGLVGKGQLEGEEGGLDPLGGGEMECPLLLPLLSDAKHRNVSFLPFFFTFF